MLLRWVRVALGWLFGIVVVGIAINLVSTGLDSKCGGDGCAVRWTGVFTSAGAWLSSGWGRLASASVLPVALAVAIILRDDRNRQLESRALQDLGVVLALLGPIVAVGLRISHLSDPMVWRSHLSELLCGAGVLLWLMLLAGNAMRNHRSRSRLERVLRSGGREGSSSRSSGYPGRTYFVE
ncbi:hypothetical protein [uncultured Friedmanniella sp.]|uniref:hypothetical protein n=1 Tax=uncultured Friedmanniella sp. TaxID=335381 RepID=UPI0035CB4873